MNNKIFRKITISLLLQALALSSIWAEENSNEGSDIDYFLQLIFGTEEELNGQIELIDQV